jgi:hypothetical protein
LMDASKCRSQAENILWFSDFRWHQLYTEYFELAADFASEFEALWRVTEA